MRSVHRPSLFWPLMLIGLGALLLLENFGLLPAGLWAMLARTWPILLILLGLDMLIGRRSLGGALLVLLLAGLVLAAALTWMAARASALPAGKPQTIEQFSGGVRSASVKLDFQVGVLNVASMNDPDRLMKGEAYNGPGESVQQTYYLSAGAGLLVIAQQQEALFAPFLAARNAGAHYDIRLTSGLPLSLEVRTDVGATTLDLSGLNLTGLDLKTGVGQTNVIVPARGRLQATLEARVGDVTLSLPTELPARLTVNSALTGAHIPPRFARDGNVYTTAGFSTEGDYLDLTVNAGVGSVTVN